MLGRSNRTNMVISISEQFTHKVGIIKNNSESLELTV